MSIKTKTNLTTAVGQNVKRNNVPIKFQVSSFVWFLVRVELEISKRKVL